MPTADYHALRILIVDDITHARTLLRSVLIRLGIREIVEANCVDDAFAVLCRGQTDVVITDWEMPGASGLDLIRAIRNDPRSPDPTLPVILLTAHGSVTQVRLGRDAGATDFLVKPFTTVSIAERLNSVVNHQRSNVVSPTYRGPDRRRAHRPVTVERRAAVPPPTVVLIAPDELLKARLSGDPNAIARARRQREETSLQFRRDSKAGSAKSDGISPASVVFALITTALERRQHWPDLASQLHQPLGRMLRDMRADLPPHLLAVVEQLQLWAAEPERGTQDDALLGKLLMGVRAILLIANTQDAAMVANDLAKEIALMMEARTCKAEPGA